MPEYLAPGVYVEEVDAGPKPIEGVSTSTVGMIGMTVRGPDSGLPRLVTSFADYRRKYGGYLPDTLSPNHFLPHAVRAFFENGGKRVYIRRVTASGANAPATAISTDTNADPPLGSTVTRLQATAVSGATVIQLESLRGVDTTVTLSFNMVKDGAITSQAGVSVTDYDPATNSVTLGGGGLTSEYDMRYTTVTVGTPPTTPVELQAADPGFWGNNLSIQIRHTSAARATVTGLVTGTSGNVDTVQLNTSNGFYVGAIVTFDRGQTKAYRRVTAVSGNSILVTPDFSATTDLDPEGGAPSTSASTCEFKITASYEAVSEEFDGLTVNDTTGSYYADVINANSTLLAVPTTVTPDNAATDPFSQPSGNDGLNVVLAGGTDGSQPSDNDYIGTDNGPGQRSGLQALKDIDPVSIVAVPGITSQTVQNNMIIHCETLADRFAILDPTYTLGTPLADIESQRKLYDSKYAAIYFPNVKTIDPVSAREVTMPPSGYIAGLYAKTDIERGVHKAPANVVVRGITDVDIRINKGEHDILNPLNINVIRDFRADGRAIRVWGARCVTSDSAWKYVPVRRLFIFVEESLDEGLQWVVFEPNDDKTWGRVRQSITNFLTTVWRNGALFGRTVEEAFFVRCDRTTMTQDDIDNGRLIVEVGIAPVKPAEFVIIRIQQYTAEANAS